MNATLKLLKIIGSPFAPEQKQELPENSDEALELYSYATKNKIGLYYLDSLNSQGKLVEFGLKLNYQKECEKHNKQTTTAVRIAKLFNSYGVNYAIFKSIMPFPATPNDVDIIHFSTDVEYKKAAETMLQSNYIEIKGQADASQRMFHDARECEHLDPHKKDVYDIDVYQRISASYVQYLDKRKLEKYVTEINISGNNIKVLRQEMELVTVIIHSIIPEQLCTLFVYYATLHHLAKMNPEEINRFIDIAKENNVTFSVKAHCSLVAELHQVAHGFVPKIIEGLLTELGDETSERKKLLKNDFKTPHKYSLLVVERILLEKAKEAGFRRSLIKQMAYMLISLRLSKWVISEVILRRRRETY